MTVWILDRSSTDWAGPITPPPGGTVETVALLPAGQHPVVPDDFAAPTQLGGQLGVLVGPDGTTGPLTPRDYVLWVRWAGDPVEPVTPVGVVTIV